MKTNLQCKHMFVERQSLQAYCHIQPVLIMDISLKLLRCTVIFYGKSVIVCTPYSLFLISLRTPFIIFGWSVGPVFSSGFLDHEVASSILGQGLAFLHLNYFIIILSIVCIGCCSSRQNKEVMIHYCGYYLILGFYILLTLKKYI